MRISNTVYFTLCITFLVLINTSTYAYMEETHASINEEIVRNNIVHKKNVSGFSLDEYLKNNLGFENGVDATYVNNDEQYKVWQWFMEGGRKEDNPKGLASYNPEVYYTLYCNEGRNNNHFHNPIYDIEEWDKAGLNDNLDCTYDLYTLLKQNILGAEILADACNNWERIDFKDQSLINWAQSPDQVAQRFTNRRDMLLCKIPGIIPPDDNWSWEDAREYFYTALTGLDGDGKIIVLPGMTWEQTKNAFLAKTFRAVGQQMHLIEDSSVPAHVRNDIHMLPTGPAEFYTHYEYAVDDFRKDKTNYGGFWNSIKRWTPFVGQFWG